MGLVHFVVLKQKWKDYTSDMYVCCESFDDIFETKTLSGEVSPVVKCALMVDANSKHMCSDESIPRSKNLFYD
jgi:hypothetical protein